MADVVEIHGGNDFEDDTEGDRKWFIYLEVCTPIAAVVYLTPSLYDLVLVDVVASFLTDSILIDPVIKVLLIK